ncbi:MAG: RNA polymerase sigma factor region1.1 domain-containing protein, partial [Mariprofundaceae bacterium]|nr:RNA polymerase sigma factor region1.1 domain-containing protein [Mariprofundaceae bacterium]
MADKEQVRLQNMGALMARGKAEGFITYDDLNKNLPAGLVSPDQVEKIINLFTEMGVDVVDPERAPNSEYGMRKDRLRKEDSALRADTTTLGTVIRIDDPVRMYLREMGTVELLTREGEIEIARRIEEGRTQVLEAICLCPATFREIMLISERVQEEDANLRHVLDIDEKVVNAAAIAEYESRLNKSSDDDLNDGEEETAMDAAQLDEAIKARTATPDGTPMQEMIITREEQLEEAIGHFNAANKFHDDYIALKKQFDANSEDAEAGTKMRAALESMLAELVSIPFSSRQIDMLVQRFKNAVERVRKYERAVRDQVLKAKMPRKLFIETFTNRVNDERWVDSVLEAHGDQPWAAAIEEIAGKIRENQRRVKRVEQDVEMDVGELKVVARRLTMGEAKARQAKREMIEANLRLVISIAKKYT